MPQFRCVDVGANCRGHFVAATSEDLVRQVAEHLQEVHKVKRPSQTLLNYITKNAR